MHPELERLETFYLGARRAVAENRANPTEAIAAVAAASSVDALGRTWRISPSSPPDRALFTVSENGADRPADPSEFAAASAAPTPPAPMAPAAPPVPPAHDFADQGYPPQPAQPYADPGYPQQPQPFADQGYPQQQQQPQPFADQGYPPNQSQMYPDQQVPPQQYQQAPQPGFAEQEYQNPPAYLQQPGQPDPYAQPLLSGFEQADGDVKQSKFSGLSGIVDKARSLPRAVQIVGVIVIVAVLAMVLRPLYASDVEEAPVTTVAGVTPVEPATDQVVTTPTAPAPTAPAPPEG